jgi:hypothetical protein
MRIFLPTVAVTAAAVGCLIYVVAWAPDSVSNPTPAPVDPYFQLPAYERMAARARAKAAEPQGYSDTKCVAERVKSNKGAGEIGQVVLMSLRSCGLWEGYQQLPTIGQERYLARLYEEIKKDSPQ